MSGGQKRELWADYAKGICILLVFVGHSDYVSQTLRTFIYLFHMPMFFFCMGSYLNTSIDFGTFVQKKFKQLMIPFFVAGFLLVGVCPILRSLVVGNPIIWKNFYDSLLGLILQIRSSHFRAPYWFLTAAFVANILFYLLRNIIKNITIELSIVIFCSVVFVYISKLYGVTLPWYLDVAFPCVLFIYLGNIVKAREVDKKGGWILLVCLAIGMTVLPIILWINRNSQEKYFVDYHTLKCYPYLLVTIGGISLCLFFYGILKKAKSIPIISYIGRNSLIYYLFDSYTGGIANKCARLLGISNDFILFIVELLGIIVITPFIVMLIKYFAWFLFGLKKEPWSFDYSRFVSMLKNSTN